MSAVLFISAYLPSPHVPAAGNQLSYQKLLELRKNFNRVDVVTFTNYHERSFHPSDENIIKYTTLQVTVFSRLIAAILYPTLPFGVSVRTHLARSTIRLMSKKNRYELIYVDFLQAANLADITLTCTKHLRIHDVMSQMYLRQKKRRGIWGIVSRIEYLRSKWYERRVISLFTSLSFLSEKDRLQLLPHITLDQASEIEKPIVRAWQTTMGDRSPEKGRILFFGNLSRFENEDGAIYFVREIFPIILSMRPHATLVIAGANPSDAVKRLASPSVVVPGYIDDLSSLYGSCELAVAPLRYGAGVKIKVLEAIESGVPIVCTSIGAEGIEHHPLLKVADSPVQFAHACVAFLS